MKRIKILIIITTIFFCAFIPLGCKKSFLEQTNTFGISPEAAASKPEQVISLVNSIYDTYQNSDLLKKCIWYRANFGTHLILVLQELILFLALLLRLRQAGF